MLTATRKPAARISAADARSLIGFAVEIAREAERLGIGHHRPVESFYATLDDAERAAVDVMILDDTTDPVARRLLLRRPTWAKRFATHVGDCSTGLLI